MKINTGLFAGIDIPENEVKMLKYSNGEQVPFWATAFRTPVFLSVFSPIDGWHVVVENCNGVFDLPDNRRAMDNEVLVQPTQCFTAKLIKDSTVVATASSLAIIDGPSAWEAGETNARGRLYDALGLSGALPLSQYLHLLKPATKDPIPQVSATMDHHGPARDSDAGAQIIAIPTSTSSRSKSDEVAAVEKPTQLDTARSSDAPAVSEEQAMSSTPAKVLPTPSLPTEDGAVVQVLGSGKRSRTNRGKNGSANISSAVDENLREHLVYIAGTNGTEIPSINTNQEAKDFLKKMLGADEVRARAQS